MPLLYIARANFMIFFLSINYSAYFELRRRIRLRPGEQDLACATCVALGRFPVVGVAIRSQPPNGFVQDRPGFGSRQPVQARKAKMPPVVVRDVELGLANAADRVRSAFPMILDRD